MLIRVSAHDGVPIYLQIVNQVKYLVASGRLQPGQEIPPIRSLAQQLVVNPNTVAKAYHELEREGVVTKRHGAGTYISDARSPLARRERMKIIAERVDALLAEARHMDVGLNELIELVRQRQSNLEAKENK